MEEDVEGREDKETEKLFESVLTPCVTAEQQIDSHNNIQHYPAYCRIRSGASNISVCVCIRESASKEIKSNKWSSNLFIKDLLK